MNKAIILAAGKSERLEDKIFKFVNGKMILYYSINAFNENKRINEVTLVIRKDKERFVEDAIQSYQLHVDRIVYGGNKRQDSSFKGLKAVEADKDDIVLFHNAANPLVSQKEIDDVIHMADKYGAAALGFPSKDTIKEIGNKGFVKKTLNRERLWQIQTPQAMRYGLAMRAFKMAYKDGFYSTDDVSLVERIGVKPRIVQCSYENIKITYPIDLMIVEQILKNRQKNRR